MNNNLDTSGLRGGERFPFTSGGKKFAENQGNELHKLFSDFNKIFSPKNEESLPDFSDIPCKHTELDKPMSNCCGVEMGIRAIQLQLCPKCLNHCQAEYQCKTCGHFVDENLKVIQ